jgi:hypothetical protein
VLVHLLQRLLPGRPDVRPAVAAVSQGLVHARLARFGPGAAPLNIPISPSGQVIHGVGPGGLEPGLGAVVAAAAAEAPAVARAWAETGSSRGGDGGDGSGAAEQLPLKLEDGQRQQRGVPLAASAAAAGDEEVEGLMAALAAAS